MTMRPEMKFACDRCTTEVNVSMNEQPAQNRARPPMDWTVLWKDDSTLPPMHLCPLCAPRFLGFMEGDNPVE
jgi:hypothetical protein